MRPDPVRDRGSGQYAQQDAGESENLRDGAAQESANQERSREDQKGAVEPRELLEEAQLSQFSCVRRAMFFRLAAFNLRLRRSLGFSKC